MRVGGEIDSFQNPQAAVALGDIVWRPLSTPDDQPLPWNANALPLRRVPPIIFSETLYDLTRVAGG